MSGSQKVIIDLEGWVVTVAGQARLPARYPFRAIHLLAKRPGVIRPWGEIADWIGCPEATPESIATTMKRARQAIGPGLIMTRRNIGYFWNKSVPVEIIKGEADADR